MKNFILSLVVIVIGVIIIGCSSTKELSNPAVQEALEQTKQYLKENPEAIEQIKSVLENLVQETEKRVKNEIKEKIDASTPVSDSMPIVKKAVERIEPVVSETAEKVETAVKEGVAEIKNQAEEEVMEEITGEEINKAAPVSKSEPEKTVTSEPEKSVTPKSEVTKSEESKAGEK